jgi:5,10-methylenetetrahydromethanopterin reductase
VGDAKRLELWTVGVADARSAGAQAQRAERAGFDGWAVVDSQTLSGDPYVALALAARETERIRLGTGVTNPATRHAAATASAIASVHAVSGGRAVLAIGRGDSALAHLGSAPARVAVLERYLAELQAYLRGDEIPFERVAFDEHIAPPLATLGLADAPKASRLHSRPQDLPKVPVEVACTGPRVIAAAARHADGVLLAVGADPERVAWGVATASEAARAAGRDPSALRLGAFVNVVAHADVSVARALVRGGLSTFARFSVMHGAVAGPASAEQREVLARVHRGYHMTQHTRADSAQAGLLPPAFVDRFAVAGPPAACIARLRELVALGLEKLVLVGPTAGADPAEAAAAHRRLAEEVLPALR